MAKAKKLLVRQIKSSIGRKPKHRATLRALGLRKINAHRIHDDNPVIRGMIEKVHFLVSVEEIEK
jgi:large subunit ribosomal protein L30